MMLEFRKTWQFSEGLVQLRHAIWMVGRNWSLMNPVCFTAISRAICKLDHLRDICSVLSMQSPDRLKTWDTYY